MSWVIDASVAAKWVLPESDADLAGALRAEVGAFVAPSLIMAEIASVAWKYARRGEITRRQAIAAVHVVRGLLTRFAAEEELSIRATEIALDISHPVYDCFYLALAEREQIPLISADRKLLAAAQRLGTVQVKAL